ncbi:small subunit processome component 20 homolog [Ptychodera flava]|uniref:small subunit processome component 20 homolog n=1 Tax=Ptychodera flava TaxID=63121 RepID=UPI00396A804A
MMKRTSKSSHHKETNRFKFQTFSERISQINVDVIRKGTQHADLEECDSYFVESYLKWQELDCTNDFVNFCRDLRSGISTYLQVVHHKQKIIDALKKHLQVKKSLALKALLDLVVQLAKDLQIDFYEVFRDFFEIIVALLEDHPQDTELLEAAFQCLGYLIKFLWRYLLKDIEDVFLYYVPLFSDQKKEYIHHFAAESFAFLLRKLRQPDQVLNFIFQHVKSKSELHEGVGILMFEVMKGVKRQFHSSADRFFSCLVKKIAFVDPSEDATEDVVSNILSQTVLKMAKHSAKNDTSFVSSVLAERISSLKKHIENTNDLDDDTSAQLHGLFKLLHLWIQHKHTDSQVTSVLCKMLECDKLTVSLLDDLLDIVITIATEETKETKTLISLIYGHAQCNFQQIHGFTRKLLQLQNFDTEVLPYLVKYISNSTSTSEDQRLLLLTEVVISQRAPPCDGTQLQQYQPYQLQLPSDIVSYIQTLLSCNEDTSSSSNSVSTLWSALVCLPHIIVKDKAEVSESVTMVIDSLSETVLEAQDADCLDIMMHVLSQAIITSVCCRLEIKHSVLKDLCQIVIKHGSSISVLQAIELWLVAMVNEDDCKLDKEEIGSIKEVIPVLVKNVSSSNSKIRLHSLSVLVQLHSSLTELEDDGIFEVCLQAERVSVTLHTYREKLKCLQQLMFVSRNHYPQVPLLYLFGALYVNFSLLWQPICDHIKTLAYEMNAGDFWSMLHSHLKDTIDQTKHRMVQSDEDVSMETSSDGKPSNVSELFLQHHGEVSKPCDKPDFEKHRHLLMKAISSFADKAEAKSRILSPLLLDFIKDEYEPTDEIIASSQDLRIDAVNERTITKMDRKKAIKCLVDHLEVFSKFKDGKSMYMESSLKELYLKLLHHPDSEVQRLALKCILTYKYNYLVPYQENLTRLLDVKSFSEELVAFSVDEDHGVINAEHREQLLPILVRILYGRMLIKTGGKSKKSVILRFLGGCKPTELSQFMDLVMEPVMEWTKDIKIDATESEDSLDIAEFIPLTKLRSILDVCSILLSKLYHVMEPYLSSILHVILNCTAKVTNVLTHRDLVHTRHIKSLRKLRQRGVEILTQFFTQCDGYQYTETEIDGLFTGIVWPVIERLPQEGVYSPTAVLKLSHAWSNRLLFHGLLVYCPNGQNQQVLGQIMNLLSSDQAEESVTSAIVSIIDNLLPQPDEIMEESDEGKKGTLPEKYKAKANNQCLLLPYVSVIIDHLKKVIQRKSRVKKQQKLVLPMKELQILSRLSIYVIDADQCNQLVDLLIPLVQIIKNVQELLLEVLQTIKKLIPHNTQPRKFVRSCSKLLSWLPTSDTRILCCDIINCLGLMDPQLQEVAELIVKLNAVDRRHLHQPDYNVRFSAFQQILATINAMETIDLDYVIPLMNNCFYFISKVDDMSLRDNAVSVISGVIKKVSETATSETDQAYEMCINSMVISALKDGLSNKSEVVRFEHLGILTQLVKSFPDNQKFKDLKVLEDENLDKDFFENIKHLQHHRQMRALRLLVQKCEQNLLGSYTLKTFMLPTATSIIFDPNLSKNNQLVMDATAAVGAIAKCLPWQPYIKLLQQYIGLLFRDTQQPKTIVKLLTVVLDSYHFDLTQYVEQEDTSQTNRPTDGDEGNEDGISTAESSKQNEDRNKFKVIVKNILPNLNKSLTQKIQSEDEHRSVRQGQAGDLEIARIPIAIAMVRLLLSLPSSVRNQHLPRIIIKVCHLLKSRASDVRQSARTTLIKIMSYLGPNYFQFVITELQQTLTRGYQKHVLSFTVHALLQGVSESLNHGDLDGCLANLIQVSNEELFGEVAEEKEVVGITRKLQEAQSSKSYDIYQIIGKYISAGHLSKIINTFKEVLDNTHNVKVVRKVEDVLRKFIQGLLENRGLSSQDQVILVHGIITQTLPFMIVDKKEQEKKTDNRSQEKNVLLLQETPKRVGPKPLVQKKTNLHVLVEFGLQLLFMLLKRGCLTAVNQDHLSMLDPLIPILVDSMQSKYIKVTISAVQCLCRLLQFSLPQLKENASRLAGLLFQQLKMHARGGSGKGDNLQLVQWSFKTMTVFIKTMHDYKITADQQHVLLSFVEEDIYDNSRQSTAFPLLRAILSRKLQCKEIDTVMKKVAELSITSDTSNIRVQCRQLMSQFLLDYPLGKKVQTYLDFYISQLVYEYEDGRKSALEILATIFTSFPQELLVEKAGLFYVPMATRLVNDESAECRKLIALALKTLLDKLTSDSRDNLFTITLLWLRDEQVVHQQLASQLIGLFVEVEKTDFDSRIKDVLPVLTEQLEPDNYDETGNESSDKERDHALFNLLTSFGKILQYCSFILNDKDLKSTVKTAWSHVHAHILHSHTWVRLGISQLYGQLFSLLSAEELETYLGQGQVRQLVKDFCQQLHSQHITSDLVDQVCQKFSLSE